MCFGTLPDSFAPLRLCVRLFLFQSLRIGFSAETERDAIRDCCVGLAMYRSPSRARAWYGCQNCIRIARYGPLIVIFESIDAVGASRSPCSCLTDFAIVVVVVLGLLSCILESIRSSAAKRNPILLRLDFRRMHSYLAFSMRRKPDFQTF
jgi:hypothetical protein